MTIKRVNKKRKIILNKEIEDSDISEEKLKKDDTTKKVDLRRSNNYYLKLLI